MRLFAAVCFLCALSAAVLRAEPATLPAHTVVVAPMKTSIYVGSVRLNTGTFAWQNGTFTTTYDAKVVPWIFWSEHGKINIKLPADTLTRLASGQTVEFTGEALNDKNKTRAVTGRAQPASPTTGKIKVRIMADGIELIFNSTYEFVAEKIVEHPIEAATKT